MSSPYVIRMLVYMFLRVEKLGGVGVAIRILGVGWMSCLLAFLGRV